MIYRLDEIVQTPKKDKFGVNRTGRVVDISYRHIDTFTKCIVLKIETDFGFYFFTAEELDDVN